MSGNYYYCLIHGKKANIPLTKVQVLVGQPLIAVLQQQRILVARTHNVENGAGVVNVRLERAVRRQDVPATRRRVEESKMQ